MVVRGAGRRLPSVAATGNAGELSGKSAAAAFAAGSFLAYGRVADPIKISPWLIVGATIASWLYYGFGLTVAVLAFALLRQLRPEEARAYIGQLERLDPQDRIGAGLVRAVAEVA